MPHTGQTLPGLQGNENKTPMHRAAVKQALSGEAEKLGNLALILDNLDRPEKVLDQPGRFRLSQLNALFRHVPYTMAGNLLAAAAFCWSAWPFLSHVLLVAWALLLVAPSLCLLAIALFRQVPSGGEASRSAIRNTRLCAALFGAAWAALPALFFITAPTELRILLVSMALAASGAGAFALGRVPSAGILFTLTICVALAAVVMPGNGTTGVVFAVMVMTYAGIMVASMLSAHAAAVERSAATEQMTRQKQIIALLLNEFEWGSSDWLWETNSSDRLVYFSDRLAELLGRGRDRLIGATLQQAAGTAPGQDGWQELATNMAAHQPFSGLALAVKIGESERWWNMSARPLVDDEGAFTGYRGVGRDITAEHNAHRQLLLAKEEAERASIAKSQFLAMMSHELKTPLNAIIGFSELIAAGPTGKVSPAEQAEHAKTILESSRHLRSLINDILDISRIDKGTMSLAEQSGDLVEVTEIAVKMCRGVAGAGNIEIVMHYPQTAEVTGDITRIKQVIVNLVTNAVKFSPAGGSVDIIIDRTADNGAAIEVLDRGIGIPPEDRERVFEPFVQVDEGAARRFGGLGLGLPIARKIARLHGGDVVLESRPGHGTMARFILPPARIVWEQHSGKMAVA